MIKKRTHGYGFSFILFYLFFLLSFASTAVERNKSIRTNGMPNDNTGGAGDGERADVREDIASSSCVFIFICFNVAIQLVEAGINGFFFSHSDDTLLPLSRLGVMSHVCKYLYYYISSAASLLS